MHTWQKTLKLLGIEVRQRFVTYYKKKVNRMLSDVKQLNNVELMNTYKKLEKHIDKIIEQKNQFENQTREKIVFYGQQEFSHADWLRRIHNTKIIPYETLVRNRCR